MKYEKPIVRNLSGETVSGGPPIPLACQSGFGVGENCVTGTTNPTACTDGGANIPGEDCVQGIFAGECGPVGNAASL
jgi:hypothetical protein